MDTAGHHKIALEMARQGIVLLKNDGALPLVTGTTARIAVIGGHAQIGVPTGCGSSAVVPSGGFAEVIKVGGPGIMGVGRNLFLLPSSPLAGRCSPQYGRMARRGPWRPGWAATQMVRHPASDGSR